MKMLVSEERVIGPSIDLLKDELVQLRILKDKVDHPRKGSKDLSDAVCGSIYNAISGTPKVMNKEIEIHTYKSLARQDRLEMEERNVTFAPKREMPDSMKDYLINLGMI
jgi:hypothetical protein